MAKPIRKTYTDPEVVPGNPKHFQFTIHTNVFPSIATTVEAEAIQTMAQGNGDRTIISSDEDYLRVLRTFQPEFVEIAFEKSWGRDQCNVSNADVLRFIDSRRRQGD